jgi:hypothetical protein
VPVKVNDMLILVDFVIIGTHEDKEIHIIIGNPFLATIHAMINKQQEKFILRTDDKEEAHNEKEDQEEQLVKIETDQHDVIEKEEAMKETSSVRDEDFYRAAEPQPMNILKQGFQQKNNLATKLRKNQKLTKP